MIADVKVGARVRSRLRHLLKQRGMTNRAFGKRLGHGDQWVSNLLAGRFTLALDDLDEAARAVGVLPSDLVRRDDEEAMILTPTEGRLIRAIRALPVAIRDHIRILAEYLMGAAPEEIDLLMEYRALSEADQARVKQSVAFLRLQPTGVPRREPNHEPLAKAPGTAPAAPVRRRAGRGGGVR